MSGGDNMSREEKTIWSEEKIFAVNHNAHAAAPARRFFSMTDAADTIERTHCEYAEEVRQYFHTLFPHRQWTVFSDTLDNPLPVHVELLHPTVEEPFYLLHTIGMSAAPMHYPTGQNSPEDKEAYGELCMLLPGNWPFDTKGDRCISVTDEAAWPIRLLMELGRFPHVHKLWMSYGFVLPNTENCDPFTKTTNLSGVLIVQFEGALGEMKAHDGTTIQILMPYLIYKEEIELYDEIGPDELIERILNCNEESFLLDIHRPNVAIH